MIHGVLDREPQEADRLAVLRHHNERLSALRNAVEREAALMPTPAPIEPVFERVPPELAEMPEIATRGRKAALRVQVARKWRAAEGIAGFELKPVSGLLPTFQAGAHIDVHMPNGQIRQYSIINGPGETGSYMIGVKREPDSKGGSACMNDVVREGDLLAISMPRNNFPLRRDAVKTLLVAGGIGVRPLLAMAQTLSHSRLSYELHYFAQGAEFLAFKDRVDLFIQQSRPTSGWAPTRRNASSPSFSVAIGGTCICTFVALVRCWELRVGLPLRRVGRTMRCTSNISRTRTSSTIVRASKLHLRARV